MWLVKLSIQRPILMIMVELFIIVLGIIGYSKIGVDLYPEINPPVITVTTQYPGADPEQIETLVSKVIEEEVNQIGGIEKLTSTTRENISQVIIEFELEIDVKDAVADVRSKVSRAKAKLPREVEEPLIQRLDFSDRPIIQLAVIPKDKSSHLTSAEIRKFAEDKVKPKLQKIDGVGQINVFGGAEREIFVELDRRKLLLWNETPTSVANSIKQANLNIPAGSIKEEPKNRGLRILGEYKKVSEIGDTIIKTLSGGKVLRVSDLGLVRDDLKDRESIARVNGQEVVLLEVKKQSGSNTVAVADEVKKFAGKLKDSASSAYFVELIYDGARKIHMSLNDVIESLAIAAILAVIVVYLFLGSMQSTLITGLALPTTIIASFFVLNLTGFTLNIMTLLGLTLCVGLVLDDAIVVRENIWKKIEEGLSGKEAAFKGTKQVYTAVLATSLTILATFIPVTMIPGIVGRFLATFAITVCLAVVLSTFDALTMAPMLSAYLVRNNGDKKKKEPNFVIRSCEAFGSWFSATYLKMLKWALGHKKTTLTTAFGIFVFSLVLIKFVGFTFMPASESGEIDIVVESPPGTTIKTTNEMAYKVEELVNSYPEVALFSQRIGNELGEVNNFTTYIKLVSSEEREASTTDVKNRIREDLKSYSVTDNLIVSVKDTGGGGGGRKAVSVSIQGPDIGELYGISDKLLRSAKAEVPGIADLESNLRPGRDEVKYRIDQRRTAAFGLSTDRVGNTIRGMFKGEDAGLYRESGDEYDITVRLRPEDRLDVKSMEQFTITNNRNEAIPIKAVTQKQFGRSPTKIVRIDQQRSAVIEGDLVSGAALSDVLAQLQKIMEPMLPRGYSYEFRGQAESMKDLAVGAVIALGLGALFIYMIMASLYESLIIPFSILLTIPLAIVGAIVGLLLAGVNLDIYSVIGIILLMGLVTKNAILLIDYAEQLKHEGEDRDSALLKAGVRRMRPIMMTTIAMVAGMAPIAFGFGELNKARAGMGIAAIGGLLSSTMLSLIVIPCAYVYLDNFRNFSLRLVKRVWG